MGSLKLNIRGKLMASFLLLVGIFLSVGSVVYFDSTKIFFLITRLEEQTTRVLQASKGLEADFKKTGEFFSSAISFSDEEMYQKALDQSEKMMARIALIRDTPGEDQTKIQDIHSLLMRYQKSGESIYRAITSDEHFETTAEKLGAFGNLAKDLNEILSKFRASKEAALKQDVFDIRKGAQHIQFAIVLIGLITTFSGIAIAFIMSRSIVQPLREMSDAAQGIAQGNLSATLAVRGNDEVGVLSRSFNVMVEGLRKADGQALKIARISAMVENAPYGMLFADNTHKITYMNPVAFEMLKKLEALLPCPADRIVGQEIDIFHANPERIRKLISDPKNLPHRGRIKLGEEVIELNISAVFDQQNNRIGTFTSWQFVTQEFHIIDTLQETMASLSFEATHLSDASRQMSGNLETVGKKASRASTTSKETTSNVEVVASSSEEMSATVKEISKNVQVASQITTQAVEKAHHANETISKLGESSVEIGKVIQVISSIAAQTNQLALNATIEAARSGEAGKGFSVVANEVKALAKQTSDATSEIQRRISAIQESTEEAVVAIEEIGSIIMKSSEIATSIAGAIEEQSVTTSEISDNAGEAAQGAMEVFETVDEISSATNDTAKEAEQVLMASANLSELAQNLKTLIEDLSRKR